MRVEEGFHPPAFVEGNAYTTDTVLPGLLKRILPTNALKEVGPDLERFGQEVITTMRALSDITSPPRLTQYDQWGQRIDKLETSEGWRALKAASHKEGIPAIAYERRYGEHSRIYLFVKVLLWTGDSADLFCPIGMTDGAARVLELYGTPAMKRDVFTRLISRDPSKAFMAGQWMTERPGGSDVSLTETKAVLADDDLNNSFGPQYKLDGFKWFSSATDSDVSIALARTGPVSAGSRALSLFLVPLRIPLLPDPLAPRPLSTSNGILVHRLKNKIGTHIVPTAELSLNGTTAYLLGPLDRGVKNITPVLNITRLYSSIASVGNLRKCLAIATAYSHVRAIHGGRQLLCDTPLHVAQLASIGLTYRALVHLTFGAIVLLGKAECKVASEIEERRLRILTPIVKAFASERASAAMEEAMTTLGGAGYMEENGIGRCIRNVLVEKIWEGTTTVLSLDLVRAAQDAKTLHAFFVWTDEVVKSCPTDLSRHLEEPLRLIQNGVKELEGIYTNPIAPLIPRAALFLMAYIASSIYLFEHAIWAFKTSQQTKDTDIEAFRRWVVEDGIVRATADVHRAKSDGAARTSADLALSFGEPPKVKL